MYYKQVLDNLIEKEDLFVPLIFTKKQMNILKKTKLHKKLDNAEKKQLYTSIKSKLRALTILIRPTIFYLTASNPITERLKRAEQILETLPYEKAFISGSFLFKDKYNDIDIFVISDRTRGEEKRGKLHLVYLPERALKDPIIQSAARSCLSKFLIQRKFHPPNMHLFDYMQLFQETGLLIYQNKDGPKDIRGIIFYDYYIKNKDVISSEKLIRLCDEFSKLSKKHKLNYLRQKIIEILRSYRINYLKKELREYIKVLEQEIREFTMNEHLKYYKDTYLGVLEDGEQFNSCG